MLLIKKIQGKTKTEKNATSNFKTKTVKIV